MIASFDSNVRTKQGRLLVTFALCLLVSAPLSSRAQQTIAFSPDITVILDGQTFDDEDAASDDLSGGVTPIDVGALPGGADLQAYHRPGVGHLLVLDTTVVLPGGVIATPQKVISFDGGVYSEVVDLAACGLPPGVKIDAMTTIGGPLMFSFDTPVSLGGTLYDDEDVVALSGCTWTPILDGSAAGIPADLDIDGLYYQSATGVLMMSLDGPGTVGGVSFDDEDALAYDMASGGWTLVYDGSSLHDGWLAGDLDALDLNTAPIADAGPDQNLSSASTSGLSVTLDGSGSSDPDGDPLTYTWTGPFGTASGVSPTVIIPAGTHTVTLTVDDGRGGSDTDTVTINVRALRVTPNQLTFTIPQGASPESMPFMVRAIGGSISYTIQRTASWLDSSPSSGQSSGEADTIQAIADPGSLRPGTYTGRLVVNGPGVLRGTVNATLIVTGGPGGGEPTPNPFDNGAVDAADFIPFGVEGHPMAPQSLISISGADFVASGEFLADSIPLPTVLGGVTVTFDGIPAGLILVRPGLIIAQLPMGVEPPAATMIISNGAEKAASEPQQVQVADHSPGIFTLPMNGIGQAIVTFAGTADLAAPVGTVGNGRPATAGDYLTAWVNGLGRVDPEIEDGRNSCEPDAVCDDDAVITLHHTLLKPVVRIGGVAVPDEDVLFSGSSVTGVGINEVVFRMPEGTPTGDEVSITIEIGGVVSKDGTTIAVE